MGRGVRAMGLRKMVTGGQKKGRDGHYNDDEDRDA